MSPILKREVGEHVRQARRLAAAAGVGVGSLAVDALAADRRDALAAAGPSLGSCSGSGLSSTAASDERDREDRQYASAITRGITAADGTWELTSAEGWGTADVGNGKGKGKAEAGARGGPASQRTREAYETRRTGTRRATGTGPGGVGHERGLRTDGPRAHAYAPDAWETDADADADDTDDTDDVDDADDLRAGVGTALLARKRGAGAEAESDLDMDVDVTAASAAEGKWADLRGLLLESTPSLVLSLVGLVFTGELLEHLARWRVFRRVDELFILVPMIGNLKGNLEMCLAARLGTSAAIGELDDRRTRRLLLVANMTLLGLQALLIASLAALISFVLGLLTTHRLGDPAGPIGAGAGGNATAGAVDPGLAVGEQEWHEGYTRPGWSQLVMVLATGMGAAGISSLVLGSFMSSMIVLCRWTRVDPDNITPPIAACLGDLVTLFILALLGSALVGAMDTPVPLLAVVVLAVAAAWFTKRVMRDAWVRNVARGGWVPLIGAMLISSGTGMVLEAGVAKYRGFALLAISMTGLTGALGAIHANRLATSLHAGLHAARPGGGRVGAAAHAVDPERCARQAQPAFRLTPGQGAATLYLVSFPCQAAFLVAVRSAGWIDISLGWAGWAAYAITALFSLVSAHYMTLLFWSYDLDPDSYTLPIHSAVVDFVGQLVLMLAYEVCLAAGNADVVDVAA
ncbi:hypothetical protein Q5752_005001 [Cryptotrichosporon argae]